MIMAIPFKTEEGDHQSPQQQELDQEFLTRFTLQLLHVLEAARIQSDQSDIDTSDTSITLNTDDASSDVDATIRDQQVFNATISYFDNDNNSSNEHQTLSVENHSVRNRHLSPNHRQLTPHHRHLLPNHRQVSSNNRQLSPNQRQLSSNNRLLNRQFLSNNRQSNRQMSPNYRQSKHELKNQSLSQLEAKNPPNKATNSRLLNNNKNSLNMPCCSSCRCADQTRGSMNQAEEFESQPEIELNHQRLPEPQTNNLPDLIPGHEQFKSNQMPDLVQSSSSRNITVRKPKSKFRLNMFDEQRLDPAVDESRSCYQQDFARIGRDLRSIAENFRCQTLPNLQQTSYLNPNDNHHHHYDNLNGHQSPQHPYDHPDGHYHHDTAQSSPQVNLINALVDAGIISVIRSVVGSVSSESGGQFSGLGSSPCRVGLLLAGYLVINWIRKRC